MSVIVPDTYDKLFTRCQNVTTSNSTLFLDSSTSNTKTITTNGNSIQLVTKINKSAGFFNGTTDCVVVPDSADWDFGTGDFNIEVFFNTASVAADLVFVDRSDFKLFWDQSEGKYGCTLEGTAHVSDASTPTINTWTHIRAKRTSGTLAFYVDAVAKGTADASADDVAGTSAIYIGATTTPNTFYSGWMKELRIIKGASTTVTVPTSQYTPTSEANTVLLMHFDTPATSPLAPSIAFDGTGDSISVADHADFDMTDFTCEAFFNFATVSAGQGLFGYDNTTDAGGINLQWNNSGTVFEASVSGTTKNDWTYAAVANKWIHVALVRSSGTVSLYVDGKPLSGTLSDSDVLAPSNAFHLGLRDLTRLNGYAKEFRVSNTARYTAAFTPSQSGFTVDANTKLYIKGNENNGVTTFVDSSTSPKTVTTAGDTKIKYTEDYRSCIFKDETGKFPYPVGSAKVDFFAIGSGVGYFDGTGDYLSTPDSVDWDFDADFTVEGYFRRPTNGNYDLVGNGGATGWDITWANTGVIRFYAASLETPKLESSTISLLNNTWYHLTFIRTSGTLKCFINGTLDSTTASYSTGITSANALQIGKDPDNAADYSGLMDNVRISKGVARYTATFNPPDDYDSTPADTGSMLMFF